MYKTAGRSSIRPDKLTANSWAMSGVMEISSTHHMDPGTQFPHRRFTETRASLVDINGDSLPDHVVQERLDDQRIILAAYFNTGSGFELTPTRLSTAHSKSQRRPFDLVCSGR